MSSGFDISEQALADALAWAELRASNQQEPDPEPQPNAEVLHFSPRQRTPKQPQRVLRILDPTLWEGEPVPERRWRVLSLIPQGAITILSGPGASGKSTIALQLLVAMATGEPWLGFQTTPGRSLYLSAEDDEDELHRRLAAVRAYYRTDFGTIGKYVRAIDLVGEDAVLAALSRDQIVAPTELYRIVEARVAEWRPGLVVIDALADVFGGNELARPQVRQFITTLRHLCVTYACEVLLLAHPSLSGMGPEGTGLSGSTGWGNSARQVLYFAEPTKAENEQNDDRLRTLSVRKANYAPKSVPSKLRYEMGVFVPVSGANSLDKGERERHVESLFLGLLDMYTTQGRYVSPATSSTYAPTVFAAEHRAAGVPKAEFAAAMNRLFERKLITTGEHGRPSSRRRHIVRAEPEQ